MRGERTAAGPGGQGGLGGGRGGTADADSECGGGGREGLPSPRLPLRRDAGTRATHERTRTRVMRTAASQGSASQEDAGRLAALRGGPRRAPFVTRVCSQAVNAQHRLRSRRLPRAVSCMRNWTALARRQHSSARNPSVPVASRASLMGQRTAAKNLTLAVTLRALWHIARTAAGVALLLEHRRVIEIPSSSVTIRALHCYLL
jgi:hypothetical protein